MSPPTAAAIGYGYVLSNSSTSGGTFTPIIEILDVKPGKLSGEKVVIQRNDSPTLFGEKIPGWKDAAEWEVKCVYEKGKRAVLDGLFMVPGFWKFVRPDGTSSSAFAGFVSELGDEVPLKEAMTCNFKITVNGPVNFSAGS